MSSPPVKEKKPLVGAANAGPGGPGIGLKETGPGGRTAVGAANIAGVTPRPAGGGPLQRGSLGGVPPGQSTGEQPGAASSGQNRAINAVQEQPGGTVPLQDAGEIVRVALPIESLAGGLVPKYREYFSRAANEFYRDAVVGGIVEIDVLAEDLKNLVEQGVTDIEELGRRQAQQASSSSQLQEQQGGQQPAPAPENQPDVVGE